VHTGYGLQFASLVRDLTETLRLDEAHIPGPLVPFFEALAAVNGPFEWIGDVTPAIPNFSNFWNEAEFTPNIDYIRSVPVPAVLLDQLTHFATWVIPDGQTTYGNFLWYHNVFSTPANATLRATYRLAPSCSGSLFTTESQANSARAFWNRSISALPRTNSANAAFTSWTQIFGFESQGNAPQLSWFQDIAIIMQKYCQYFNGSRALKMISPVGIGSTLISAEPQSNGPTRNWLYPNTPPAAFLSSRFPPIHEIPDRLRLDFKHADHTLEEIAEQYASLCSEHIQWDRNNAAQHGLDPINGNNLREGSYWTMMPHRINRSLNLKSQYAQLIASRYHQVTASRSE